MRLVVQREGAGTSGREREQLGVGGGGGVSGLLLPTAVEPAPGEKVRQTNSYLTV